MMMRTTVALAIVVVWCGIGSANALQGRQGVRGSSSIRQGSVYYNAGNGKLSYQEGPSDPAAVAQGSFEPGFNNADRPSGFGRLKVTTNSSYADLIQMRAAGYLEGALTRDVIPPQMENWNYFMENNMFPSGNNGEIPEKIQKWFADQDAWIQNQLKTNYTVQWEQTQLVLEQFEGFVEGYNAVASKEISRLRFQLINAGGDLMDIVSAVFPDSAPDFDKMTPTEIMDSFYKQSHCSALVKVTGNFSELYAGHSTWFSYINLIRVFKHYNFKLTNEHTSSGSLSFSSYPGILSSVDDFYMMKDSNLSMLQTTNAVLNKTLYSKVTNQSLLAWHRVRTANLLASSGEEWAETVKWPNSGTYNNQYMIINMGFFSPGKALPPGTLWVIEQIPGLVVYADTTQQLERGYWPSYNIPYFPIIYNESGFQATMDRFPDEKYGELAGLQYQMAPRAQIFRRDQGNVVDMDSYKAIMRYNNYQHDPASKGNPMNAICSRADLAGSVMGCYDTKVTSWSWFQQQRSAIVNGPTQSHGLPPFSWSEQNGKYEHVSHTGQPKVFDFEFQDEYFSDNMQWNSYRNYRNNKLTPSLSSARGQSEFKNIHWVLYIQKTGKQKNSNV